MHVDQNKVGSEWKLEKMLTKMKDLTFSLVDFISVLSSWYFQPKYQVDPFVVTFTIFLPFPPFLLMEITLSIIVSNQF